MPPLFKMKVELNQNLLGRIRELPARYQRNLRRRLVTEVGPKLQTFTNAIMLAPVGPRSDPFIFGGSIGKPQSENRSRLYYLLVIIGRENIQKGARYPRTLEIEGSFRVEVSDRVRLQMVTVKNIHPKARFVIGPHAVQGHINTGWVDAMEKNRRLLRQYFIQLVAEQVREAWRDAKRGVG